MAPKRAPRRAPRKMPRADLAIQGKRVHPRTTDPPAPTSAFTLDMVVYPGTNEGNQILGSNLISAATSVLGVRPAAVFPQRISLYGNEAELVQLHIPTAGVTLTDQGITGQARSMVAYELPLVVRSTPTTANDVIATVNKSDTQGIHLPVAHIKARFGATLSAQLGPT